MNTKKVFVTLLLALSAFGSFADPLPDLSCGNAYDYGYLDNLIAAGGCHYSSNSIVGTYQEAPEDVGVSLLLPPGVDSSDRVAVANALAKTVVYLDGWQESSFASGFGMIEQYRQSGAAILWVLPGVASTESTLSYADKVRSIMNDLNIVKSGLTFSEPNVMIGWSLGGVAGRVALAKMEQSYEIHNTALFISYDAPQTGATTPSSIVQIAPLFEQYITLLQNFYDNADPVLKPYISLANTGAHDAKALLEQVTGSYTNSGIFKEILIGNAMVDGTERAAYVAELNAIGYPVNTRKIGVSLGTLATENTISADPADGTYFNLTGRTHSGAAYGYLTFNMFPTASGAVSVSMDVGAIAQKTTTWRCWWWTCSNTTTIKASLPRSEVVSAGVTNLDKVPGSYIDILGITWGAGKVLTDGIYSCASGSPVRVSPAIIPYSSQYTNSSLNPACIGTEIAYAYDITKISNTFEYTFIPTASAFGLPADSSPANIQAAYQDNSLSPFDLLISIPETIGQSTTNLSHGAVQGTTAIDSEIMAVLQL